jgi:hypothetical protein
MSPPAQDVRPALGPLGAARAFVVPATLATPLCFSRRWTEQRSRENRRRARDTVNDPATQVGNPSLALPPGRDLEFRRGWTALQQPGVGRL